MDRFSPVAAAHIRALVLPVGRLERAKFIDFVRRLQDECAVIAHADLKGLVDDGDDFALSPKKCEQGKLLFNFTPSSPHEGLLQLSPYELFREPLLVVGVAEGLEGDAEARRKELKGAAEYLREKHPRVVHRHLLILQEGEEDATGTLDNAIRVDNAYDAGHPALRQAISALTIRFLRELTTYAQAMQASPSIPTPGQTSKAIQRTSWLRDADHARSGSTSGYHTPRELHSPVEEDSPGSRPPPRSRDSPATSFDQIPSASNAASALARSESNRGRNGRAGSQDRVSVQGFGTSNSQEKTKKRGKARVGIVLGCIYMMAGVWNESLQLLVEHTTQARSLQDHLWHAKGLENIIACLLLHAWAGLEFQIPSICFANDKRSSSIPAQRFSANLSADAKAGTASNQVAFQRLSLSIPEIVKQLSNLFQSTEGPMELSSLVLCEVTIRLTKLLATLHKTNGTLNEAALIEIVESKPPTPSAHLGPATSAVNSASAQTNPLLTRSAIADMAVNGLPSPEDSFSIPDHLTLLAGVASVYSLLGMSRKKALTMRDLVVRLTAALNQARKIGAAEMGIHPAASLSAENGADALISSIHESEGVINMIADVANIYGVALTGSEKDGASDDAAERQRPAMRVGAFGGEGLKFEALRDLLALCEASPDPYGILRLIASFFSSAGPNAAIDKTPEDCGVALVRDEQAHLASLMNKTIGVSRQLGLADAQADYWDPFLLRSIEIVPPSPLNGLLDRSKLGGANVRASQQTPSNPLLYDPNTSRQATAQQPNPVLVQGESVTVLLTLQNPYDLALDIESFSFVTSDSSATLTTHRQPLQLGAARLQTLPVSATPTCPGKCVIAGARIKIAGCRDRFFPIARKPWAERDVLTIKSIGQEARFDPADTRLKPILPEYSTVEADVIPPLPTLVLEGMSLREASLMLLEGEKQGFTVSVRNTSDTPAKVLDVVSSSAGLAAKSSPLPVVPARGAVELPLEVVGHAGVSKMRADIVYASASASASKQDGEGEGQGEGVGWSDYARALSIPLHLTVNAALQILSLDVSTPDPTSEEINLALDLRNAWPEPLTFTASTLATAQSPEEREGAWREEAPATLPPAQIQRIHLLVPRWHGGLPEPMPTHEELRNQLLSRLKLEWSTPGYQRRGTAFFGALPFPADAASILLGPRIYVAVAVSPSEAGNGVVEGEPVMLTVRLHNRSETRTGPLKVTLRPSGEGEGGVEVGRAVVGALERLVKPLGVEEKRECRFSVWGVRKGGVGIRAVVGEVGVGGRKGSGEEWGSGEVVLKVA